MLFQNKLLQILAIAILILLQVVIFSNINFMGFVNPLIYILFIALLPLDTNKYLALIYAFVLGIGVDFFEMTGGINAFSTVLITFIRPFIVRVASFGSQEDAENIKLFRFNFIQWFVYLVIIIFTHHFIILLLERFSFNAIQQIILQTSIGSAITLILVGIFIILFPPKRTSEF